MKKMNTFNKFFVIVVAICLFAACTESPELVDYAADCKEPSGIVSGTVSDNYALVVVVDGNKVEVDGGAQIQDKGVVFSTKATFDLNDANIVSNGAGLDAYSSTLTGLSPLTTYYYRAFAINSKGIAYGDEKSFKTISLDEVPRVEAEFSSSFFEDTWTVEVIAVPGIFYKAIGLYEEGYDVSINVAPNGAATVAKQPVMANLSGYGVASVQGTGKLDGKKLELNLTLTVSAGSFGTATETITLP
jgi:hypothetical protein